MLWFNGFAVYLVIVAGLLAYLIPTKPPLLMAVIVGMCLMAYCVLKCPPVKPNKQKPL